MISNPQVDEFSNRLDELCREFAERPLDDRLTRAEVVGVLQFKCFEIMLECEEARDE